MKKRMPRIPNCMKIKALVTLKYYYMYTYTCTLLFPTVIYHWKTYLKWKNLIFEGASSELDKILLTKISNFVVLMYSYCTLYIAWWGWFICIIMRFVSFILTRRRKEYSCRGKPKQNFESEPFLRQGFSTSLLGETDPPG